VPDEFARLRRLNSEAVHHADQLKPALRDFVARCLRSDLLNRGDPDYVSVLGEIYQEITEDMQRESQPRRCLIAQLAVCLLNDLYVDAVQSLIEKDAEPEG
jgi:hypothetical protein